MNGFGYAVVANDGCMVALTARHVDNEVPSLLAHFDSINPHGAPHRVARMAETDEGGQSQTTTLPVAQADIDTLYAEGLPMAKTKADAFKIRRVTIELGSDNSDALTVEIHPGSQTATLRANWPSGAFRRLENMKLEDLVDQLRGLCCKAEG